VPRGAGRLSKRRVRYCSGRRPLAGAPTHWSVTSPFGCVKIRTSFSSALAFALTVSLGSVVRVLNRLCRSSSASVSVGGVGVEPVLRLLRLGLLHESAALGQRFLGRIAGLLDVALPNLVACLQAAL